MRPRAAPQSCCRAAPPALAPARWRVTTMGALVRLGWAPPRTSPPTSLHSARTAVVAPTSTRMGGARSAPTATTAPAMYAPRFGYSVAHAVAPLKQPLMPPLMHSGRGPVGVARAPPCWPVRRHQCERVRRCEVAELRASVRRWEVQDAGVWYLQRPHVRPMRGLRGRTREVQLSGVDLKKGRRGVHQT